MKSGLGAKKKNLISMPSTSVLATTVVAQDISLANALPLSNPQSTRILSSGDKGKGKGKGSKGGKGKGKGGGKATGPPKYCGACGKNGHLPEACFVTYPHLKRSKKVQGLDGEEPEVECNFIDLGVLEVSDDIPTMIEDEDHFLDQKKVDFCRPPF